MEAIIPKKLLRSVLDCFLKLEGFRENRPDSYSRKTPGSCGRSETVDIIPEPNKIDRLHYSIRWSDGSGCVSRHDCMNLEINRCGLCARRDDGSRSRMLVIITSTPGKSRPEESGGFMDKKMEMKEYEVEVTIKRKVRVVSQDRVDAEKLATDLLHGCGAESSPAEPCLMNQLAEKGFTVTGGLRKGPDELKAEMTDPVSGTRIRVEPCFLTTNESSGVVDNWTVNIQTVHGVQYSQIIEANRNAIHRILCLWAMEAK